MFTVLEVEAALVTYKKIEVDRYRVEAAPSLKIGLPYPHTIANGWQGWSSTHPGIGVGLPHPPLSLSNEGMRASTNIIGWTASTYGGQPLANPIFIFIFIIILHFVSSMFWKVKAEHFSTFCFSETHFNYLSDVALINNNFHFFENTFQKLYQTGPSVFFLDK